MDDTLLQVITELPTSLRVPFILRRFGGYKYKEIAELLQVETSTVGVYIADARQRLVELGFDAVDVWDDPRKLKKKKSI